MRLARTIAALAGSVLVGYHTWLLASQIADGRLAEPWLLARWIVAGGLLASLAALKRSGVSLWSHKAVAIWVLAALLHGPAVAADARQALNGPALPEAVATLVFQVASTSGLLAVGVWLLAGALASARRGAPALRWFPLWTPGVAALAFTFASPLSPRPPPLS